MKLRKVELGTRKRNSEVIACCDHRGCNNSKTTHILYAVSMKAARDSADRLNMERDIFCPKCKRRLGFFPIDHTNE